MKQDRVMRASIESIAPRRDRRAQNRMVAIVLLGVMFFLMAVSVVTILVKN
jgi:hypothetical protein